jgi:hypothetical protein
LLFAAAALLLFVIWQGRAFWHPDNRAYGLDRIEVGTIVAFLLSSWVLNSALSAIARRRPSAIKLCAVWLGRIAIIVTALIS